MLGNELVSQPFDHMKNRNDPQYSVDCRNSNTPLLPVAIHVSLSYLRSCHMRVHEKGIFKCRNLILVLALFYSSMLSAQTADARTDAVRSTAQTVESDEGGWRYLGQRMWYQVKKRMNMTTEEEDKAQQKEKGKNIRLKVLGVEVTKPGKK